MHLYWILTKLRSSSGSSGRFAHTFLFCFHRSPSFGRVECAHSQLAAELSMKMQFSALIRKRVTRYSIYNSEQRVFAHEKKNVYVFFSHWPNEVDSMNGSMFDDDDDRSATLLFSCYLNFVVVFFSSSSIAIYYFCVERLLSCNTQRERFRG